MERDLSDAALADASPSALTREVERLREQVRQLEREAREHELASRSAHETATLEIVRGISSVTGADFFRSLLEQLGSALGADFAVVSSLHAGSRARTLAYFRDGGEQPGFEYDIADTPCEDSLKAGVCLCSSGVRDRYPRDRWLEEAGAEAYAGTSLVSSAGEPIGVMALLFRNPLRDTARAETLLRLFAVRAAAELERLLSEERRRRDDAVLRSILDHTTAMIHAKDREGRYILVNREFERVFRTTLAQVRGRMPAEIVPGAAAEQARDNDLRVLSTETPMQRESTVRTPDGSLRTFVAVKVPLRDGEGRVIGTCGISTDITENKRLESELQHSQRLESAGRLAGGIAHDFNNLLTAIRGYMSLAFDTLSLGHPARHELLEAEKACQRAAGLTRQLLAFARKQVIQPRNLEVGQLLGELTVLLRPAIGERVELELAYAADTWRVHADPGQLELVLMNLAINARDAMPEGGRLVIQVANRTLGPEAPGPLAAGDYVEIRVRDTGHGIPPEVQPRIFEPFFTTKPVGQGTGLGLATCHGIVQQSRGHISFESRPGEGTTFTLLLPRGADAAAADAPPAHADRSRGHGTVLVVEDEALLRDILVRSLRAQGYQVLEAASAEAAERLERTHTGPLDLLLTDVVMPGRSGPELATRLLARRPGLRVLLSSGHTDDVLVRHGIGEGDWNYLQKPYTPAELAAKVREVLAAREA